MAITFPRVENLSMPSKPQNQDDCIAENSSQRQVNVQADRRHADFLCSDFFVHFSENKFSLNDKSKHIIVLILKSLAFITVIHSF